MRKVGLLAGVGRLPVEFARAASGMGVTVIAVGVVPGADEELSKAASKTVQISIGELDKIFAFLKEEGISEVTMLGKVTKELMFSGEVAIDARMRRLLAGLKDYSDDTVMLGFVKELAAEGIGVLDQTALIRYLMPSPGTLSSREPTEAERADMEFGFKIAKQMGSLDIGQTVVVKNAAVMAVEAIEGTDACIRRGAELGGGGVTVAKTAKPGQDLRFDMPSIGPDTLQIMADSGAVALVIEAGKTLMVNQEKTLAIANKHGIVVVAR